RRKSLLRRGRFAHPPLPERPPPGRPVSRGRQPPPLENLVVARPGGRRRPPGAAGLRHSPCATLCRPRVVGSDTPPPIPVLGQPSNESMNATATGIPLKEPAVSAVAGDTEQLERAYIDASTRVPVLMFYPSAMAWLILGTLLAGFVSFKLHEPDLLSNISFL